MARTGIFISYSHRDEVWLQQLRVHLGYLERRHQLDVWDDQKIRPGSNWREEITLAICSARVALLLVSAHFISSDFINDEELPALLAAAEKEGARIIPLIVSHCMFKEIDAISRFQSANSPDRPLVEMSDGDRDALFTKITREIVKAFETTDPLAPPDKTTDRKALVDVYRLSLSRINTLHILATASKEGRTLTEIWQQSNLKRRKFVVESLQELEAAGMVQKQKKGSTTYWNLTEEGEKLWQECSESNIFRSAQ